VCLHRQNREEALVIRQERVWGWYTYTYIYIYIEELYIHIYMYIYINRYIEWLVGSLLGSDLRLCTKWRGGVKSREEVD